MSKYLFASFGRSRLISTFGKCPLNQILHKTRCRELTPLLHKEYFYEVLQSFKRKKKNATLDLISGKLYYLENSEAGEQVTQKDCAVSILESFKTQLDNTLCFEQEVGTGTSWGLLIAYVILHLYILYALLLTDCLVSALTGFSNVLWMRK